MKKGMCSLLLLTFLFPVLAVVVDENKKTEPEKDRVEFVDFFANRFKGVAFSEYKNGVYALDEDQRAQWLEIEDFPPYEFAIDTGRELFEKAFANGKSYSDCFRNGGVGIRQDYPFYDKEKQKVVTLELAINDCRVSNDETPLKYKKGPMAEISAYMAYTSRDNKINVVVPDDPYALNAYEEGKAFYYSKRGQLNFSCADCHALNSGNNVRADKLSPGLGHTTHFPVYRSKWGNVGTLHRRFIGCNENIRAEPLPAQSDAYRNLEYFMSYMSNGLEFNGPGARK